LPREHPLCRLLQLLVMMSAEMQLLVMMCDLLLPRPRLQGASLTGARHAGARMENTQTPLRCGPGYDNSTCSPPY
jgi:hypothetical protein